MNIGQAEIAMCLGDDVLTSDGHTVIITNVMLSFEGVWEASVMGESFDSEWPWVPTSELSLK